MLFKQYHLERIKSGEISLAFRKWKRLAVKSGSLVKTAIGLVRIGDVKEIAIAQITESDARKAGFKSVAALLKLLQSVKEGTVYRIEVAYHAPDPRIALRNRREITEEEFEQLKRKLEKLDYHSKVGVWTYSTLLAIQRNPKLKAMDLAVMLSKEKDWLKLNIRKLKNLGLTISHHPGYEISPFGEAYLRRVRLKEG